METNDPPLDQFCNHDSFVDSPSHGLEYNLIRTFVLEQGGGVGDVVAHPPLRGDADLILLDGRLLPRLLHPLVPVHPSPASL